MSFIGVVVPVLNAERLQRGERIYVPARTRVTYLIGAGATQGSISEYGSNQNLLMNNLRDELQESFGELVNRQFKKSANLKALVNNASVGRWDFEQLITFIEESLSRSNAKFVEAARDLFANALSKRLIAAETEIGSASWGMYTNLIDMHNVYDLGEDIVGFLTLNYDDFIERAAEELGFDIDLGLNGAGVPRKDNSITILKLHGSLNWSDYWPVTVRKEEKGLWIPPGIRKRKNDYPFNLIWGKAREILDCDILRVIGCNVGSNDWDLVSLIFATRHFHYDGRPFAVEFISDLETVVRVQLEMPYLEARHFSEDVAMKTEIVRDVLPGGAGDIRDSEGKFTKDFSREFPRNTTNAFSYWLKFKGRLLRDSNVAISTPSGSFSKFMDRRDEVGV